MNKATTAKHFQENKEYIEDICFTIVFKIEGQTYRVSVRNGDLSEIVKINPTVDARVKSIIVQDLSDTIFEAETEQYLRNLAMGVLRYIKFFSTVSSRLRNKYPSTFRELLFRSFKLSTGGNDVFSSVAESLRSLDWNTMNRILNSFEGKS